LAEVLNLNKERELKEIEAAHYTPVRFLFKIMGLYKSTGVEKMAENLGPFKTMGFDEDYIKTIHLLDPKTFKQIDDWINDQNLILLVRTFKDILHTHDNRPLLDHFLDNPQIILSNKDHAEFAQQIRDRLKEVSTNIATLGCEGLTRIPPEIFTFDNLVT